MPAQIVYLTDGNSRSIKIGKAVLVLRHTSPSVMAGAGSKAGTILQAIRYLGKGNLSSRILNKLTRQLDDKDKSQLKNLARYTPGWIKPSIDKIVAA